MAGLPAVQLDRLQSVLNVAARLIYRRRKFDHVSPLLKELYWLRVPERITFRLAVLTYRCQHNTAPCYLTAQLQQAIEQRWLPAASTLVVIGHARCSSHRTRDHRWPCVQFNCSSCVEQFANGSAVFRVTGHLSTPPEN